MMNALTGRHWAAVSALLLVAVFILANLALQPRLAGARLDFTEGQLYTLAPATRDTVARLAEPIDLTLVYSRRVGQDYPRIRAHAARVRELLEAYASVSRRQLRVRELDATPFSEAEDVALAAGLTAVPTQGTDPLYFGLIGTNSVDDQRTIPFLAPEQAGTLEYELTRLVARLDDPSPARLGLLTSLQGMRGDGLETGYAVLRDLRRSYGLERVDPAFASLPPDIDVLLVAHPGALSDYQYWLIDQFVLRGGRLVWIADPAAKIAGGGGVFDIDPAPRASDLGPLGRHWGVELSSRAVADAANALPVQTLRPDGRSDIVGQPLFIAIPAANMSRTDPVTAELARAVHFGAPGALTHAPEGPFRADTLVTTGPAPAFIDAEAAAGEMMPFDVLSAYDTLDAPLTLALRLSGRPDTAFPAGRPPLPLTGDPVEDELLNAEAAGAPSHIARATADTAIIVIADADFLDDGFYINPNGGAVIADNATFLLNAIDALTGEQDLLALRSRAEPARSMTMVDRMRAAAEAEFFDEQSGLEERLFSTQSRLDLLEAELVSAAAAGIDAEAALTPEERTELQTLRTEILDTRERLRAIERDFRREIDGLESTLKLVNIWGGPLLVVLIGLLVAWRRRAR